MNNKYSPLLAEAIADLRYGRFQAAIKSGEAFREQVERNAALGEVETLAYELVKLEQLGVGEGPMIDSRLSRIAEIRAFHPRHPVLQMVAA